MSTATATGAAAGALSMSRTGRLLATTRLSLSGWIGLVMLAMFISMGVLGPWIAPYSPTAIALDQRFLSPSAAHWLGTDKNGIDTLSQLLWGARSALFISGIVVLVSASIGVAIGAIAGYFRGWVDDLIMRVVDILLAFPGILLNIALVAAVAKPGLGMVIGVLIANGWVGYARVVRGQTLSIRERDYVTAARSLGAGPARIIARHIVPNLLAPVLVQMTFGLGGVILVEAALSFLGLGPQVDYTWGAMLDQGRTFLWREGFLHYILAPGLAITWVVVGANLLGDGLRDWLDPRSERRV